MSSIVKNLKYTAILGTITIALLVGLEGALRIIYPDAHPEIQLRTAKSIKSVYQFHPDYLFELRPGLSKTFERAPENGGDVIEWRTNANSFRGKELEKQPSRRIMVYGDSNIQARFSKLEKTFPYLLEENLGRLTGQSIEVVNAGLVGGAPDQVFLRLVNDPDKFKPEIIVFHISDNDFGDLVRNRIFEFNSNGDLIKNSNPRKLNQWEQEQLGETFWQEHMASFHLTLAARQVSKKLQPKSQTQSDPILKRFERLQKEFDLYQKREKRAVSHFADHYDLDVAARPNSEPAQIKKKLMQGILKKVQALAAAKDVKLVVLIQPSSRDMTENLPLNFTHFAKLDGYAPRNLTDAVEIICNSLGINNINLFAEFENGPAEQLFFQENDGHWNDAGQALAARITASYLYREFINRTAEIGEQLSRQN